MVTYLCDNVDREISQTWGPESGCPHKPGSSFFRHARDSAQDPFQEPCRFRPGSFRSGSFRPNFGVGRFGLGRWVDLALGRFGRSLYQNVDCLGQADKQIDRQRMIERP